MMGLHFYNHAIGSSNFCLSFNVILVLFVCIYTTCSIFNDLIKIKN